MYIIFNEPINDKIYYQIQDKTTIPDLEKFNNEKFVKIDNGLFPVENIGCIISDANFWWNILKRKIKF